MDNNHERQIITEGLNCLRTDKEITLDFYNLISSIVEGMKKSKSLNKFRSWENDDVTEFILFLQKGSYTNYIGNKKDLVRLIKKWKTMKSNPAGYEIWRKVSAALRVLEKEGLVERAPEDKKYCNSKYSLWRKSEVSSSEVYKFNEDEKIEDFLPFYQCKREDSLIEPKKVKELVLHILNLFDGYIEMNDINRIASTRIEVIIIKPESLYKNNNNDGEEFDLIDNIAAEEIIKWEIEINDSAEIRTELIWNEISLMARGKDKSIKGEKILCLYILPSSCENNKINLDDFGPSSTVGDLVKNDLYPVLKKYLYFEKINSCSKNDFMSEIQKLIISNLNKRCSENGYNTGLDI